MKKQVINKEAVAMSVVEERFINVLVEKLMERLPERISIEIKDSIIMTRCNNSSITTEPPLGNK